MLLLVMFLSAMSVEEDDNYVFEGMSESSIEFTEEPTDDDPLTPGAIAGIVIAAVLLITVVASLIWFFVTKQKNQSVSTESTDDI